MHVFLFHLSWRQQFWNILGILFILFHFELKVWKGLKTILRSKKDEWWKYAETSLAVLAILSGDYFRQNVDVCLHLFDISLSALGVKWCWGIIGRFWILSSYNSRLRWMWLNPFHLSSSFPPLHPWLTSVLFEWKCIKIFDTRKENNWLKGGTFCIKMELWAWGWMFLDRWQETFVQEVSPLYLHWSGEGQDTI